MASSIEGSWTSAPQGFLPEAGSAVSRTTYAALFAVTGQTEGAGEGFAATARTVLHGSLGFSPDVIEAQLAHAVRDSLGRAYNRTEFIAQRKEMLQAWADFLDELRLDANAAGRPSRPNRRVRSAAAG